MTAARDNGGEWYLWVANAAILVTNAAVITALEPGMGTLVLMAVITGALALATAVIVRARRHPGPVSPTPPGTG